MGDLDFLGTYWERAKTIAEDVVHELPIIETKLQRIGKFLHITQFKNLTNWSISPNQKSDSLSALADKIKTMILMGRGKDVKPMVMKIASGRIKKLSKPIGRDGKILNKNYSRPKYTADFLGHGHFRWNYRSYVLTEIELKRLKDYFGL